MNSHYPELMSELNRKRIIDDMKAIRLENEADTDSRWIGRLLLYIGDWMITSGETLLRQNAPSATYTSQVSFQNRVALKLEHKK